MRFDAVLSATTILFATALATASQAATLDFESLANLEGVGSQYSGQGATFVNAVALEAGLSLNEFEFPPHSGSVVLIDVGGPISILFNTPVTQVSGFFTYSTGLTLAAYDAANVTLGGVSSAFSKNTALSGDAGSSANEVLALAFASGISKLTITGSPLGGSFTLDDLSFSPVPEPNTAVLLALGLIGQGLFRRAGIRRRDP